MAIVLAGSEVISNAGVGPYSSPWDWDGPGAHPLQQFFRGAGYNQLYTGHPHVYTVTTKAGYSAAVLPFKTYRKAEKGRADASSMSYGRLMAAPSTRMSQFDWRMWMVATRMIYGEAAAWKIRDRAGRTVELPPVHPTRLRYGPPLGGSLLPVDRRATAEERSTENRYWYRADDGAEIQLWRRDLFLWKTFNPDSMHRGLSPLEPLRDTLENDQAAMAAMEALWKNGGKPSFVLSHPGVFGNNPAASQRLADQFERRHGGVSNWGRPLILEEGMEAHPLVLDDSLKYLELRKLTLQDVARVYMMNSIAVGDNEKSSYNNVTQLLRDFYRTTMPPILKSFEDALDFDVRDGRHGASVEGPEFPASLYVEHELDGVLRGDFEQRMEAISKGIQNSVLMPSEAREIENRPFVEGSDRLLINGALVPLDEASRNLPGLPSAQQGNGDSVDLSIPANRLSHQGHATVQGRLGRLETLDQVDVGRVVAGLDVGEAALVGAVFAAQAAAGGDVADLRAALKGLRA